jgi:hypothetical protein
MASGEVVIQSMWSPAITAVKSQGIACVYQPLKEGYRSWGGGLGLSANLSGIPPRGARRTFKYKSTTKISCPPCNQQGPKWQHFTLPAARLSRHFHGSLLHCRSQRNENQFFHSRP